ncbi:MAG: restriction endonuclease subunit R, partial [Actinomycetota bacterium]|nr:restriction endonuclease subunit R [Actinomycetota bacterium]
ALIGEGLYYPTVPEGRDFAGETRIVLNESKDIKVNLDLSVRAESMRMGEGGVSTVASKAGAGRLIGGAYLSMLDWTAIHLDLLDYKTAKGYRNLLVPSDAPRRIMEKDPAVYNLVADGSVFEPRSFAELAVLRDAVQAILRKYVDKFYGVRRQRWDSENMVLKDLDGGHPNFADYTVKIKSSEKALVEEVKALASRANGAHNGEAGSLPNIRFDRHLYQPLLKDRGDEIKVSPPGLEESEEKFVSALERYCRGENGGTTRGKELFLLRNLTRNKGVGFFTAGFYPDFILWVKEADGSQKVVFVEPHGMRNDNPPPNNEKVALYLALRDLSDRMEERDGPGGVFLDSYIVSATPHEELDKKWGGGWTRERFARQHVLFEDDLDARIPALLEPRDDLERRIFTSYPPPWPSTSGR